MTDENATAGAGVPPSAFTALGNSLGLPVFVHYLKDAPATFETLRVTSYNITLSELRKVMMAQQPAGGWTVDLHAPDFALSHVPEAKGRRCGHQKGLHTRRKSER